MNHEQPKNTRNRLREVDNHVNKQHNIWLIFTFPFVLAAGIMLTALFKFIATGAGAGIGDVGFLGDSHFSLGFAVAVTVIPRVARIFATAFASDFFGL